MCTKKKLLTSLLCIVFLFVLITTGSAQNITHLVKSGETLFGIAEQYEVSIQQLKTWNNLKSNQLSIGQQLLIKEQDSPNSSGITHTVEAEETLFSIARRYGVTIDDLKRWNNVKGSSLALGTELTIYPDRQKKDTSARPAALPDSESSYTVKSGDSLFRIAQMYNMSVQDLKRLNNLSSNNIQVGQRLKVLNTGRPYSLTRTGIASSAQGQFVHYKIKRSQSLAELLTMFQMDEAELRALNPGLSDTLFLRGEMVHILAPPTQTFKNPYLIDSGLQTLGSTPASPYRSLEKITPTTSGELYNPEALTAGHSTIALGSVIFIKNAQKNRGVFVRINDRISADGLKLSAAAWKALALTGDQATVTMFRHNE